MKTIELARDTPDWMLGSFWAPPERVLDRQAREATSGFARMDESIVRRVCDAVKGDLDRGVWDHHYGHLRALDSFDTGLRLITNRPNSPDRRLRASRKTAPLEGERMTTLRRMSTHRDRVEALLADAATEHASLMAQLPPAIRASIPVDAQGVTQAIDHLALAAGLSVAERRELVRPHAVNPAVMHARVFGPAPLARETVIASFVDGARVRADALSALADMIGGEPLGREVRGLLVENPPPVRAEGEDVLPALRKTYDAHERAALLIAARLDDD